MIPNPAQNRQAEPAQISGRGSHRFWLFHNDLDDLIEKVGVDMFGFVEQGFGDFEISSNDKQLMDRRARQNASNRLIPSKNRLQIQAPDR